MSILLILSNDFSAENANQLVLKTNGNVGIGMNAPKKKFEVLGNIYATGDIGASGAVTGESITGTTISDGTLSFTGGYMSGASGKVSMWTNDAGYITGIAWSEITGTLANQTDLNTELTNR